MTHRDREADDRASLAPPAESRSFAPTPSSTFRFIPWCAQGVVVGKALAGLDLPRRFEVTVLGFWRANDLQAGARPPLQRPRPDYRIEGGDTLLLIGQATAVEKFLEDE